MKKTGFIFLMTVTCLLAGCGSKKQSVDNSELVSLETVRGELDQTMEKAYNGAYENLTFAQFEPVFTNENEVADITETGTQTGTKEKTIEESLSEQYQWLCEIAGEKLDKTKITDFKSNLNLEQVEKKCKEGNYPKSARIEEGYKLPNLVYMEEDDEGNTTKYITATSGKCNFCAQLGMVALSEEVEFVKEYYANAVDGSLEDTYELEDGICSVKEGLQWAENYENEGKPFPPGKNIKLSASTVSVYQRKNGTYLFNIGLRRCYKGVTFQNAYQGTAVSETTFDFDMCEIAMVNRSCPDSVEGLGANEIIEEGQRYSKIITLDRVFSILNEKVGKNTECVVLSAELSYCMHGEGRKVSKQYGYLDVCHGKVAWKVEVKNKLDDKITIFYIGATDVNGDDMEQIGFH